MTQQHAYQDREKGGCIIILFLDYDGFLHPDAVCLVHGRPVLKGGGKLFMWAPLLSDLLENYPNVRIVLSTSWVNDLKFSRAKNYLPEELRNRIIGATWHSSMRAPADEFHWWTTATRYQKILRYVDRAKLIQCVALDDDEGWPHSDETKLVRTPAETWLSNVSIQQQLAKILRKDHRYPSVSQRQPPAKKNISERHRILPYGNVRIDIP